MCKFVRHPGNVALPAAPDSDIERLLQRKPLEHHIRRKDEKPIVSNLPERVTEPVDIGFSQGHVQVIDLGHAFRPAEGAAYTKDDFLAVLPHHPNCWARAQRRPYHSW